MGWKWGLVGAAGCFVGACASSTGVLPAGPDTYTITEKYAPVRGGAVEAERQSLSEADAFCAQQGRKFVPVNMNDVANPANPNGATGYTVTFRCLAPNDPAVAAYKPQQTPTAAIEIRNR
jgi:hypothetical protein